MITVVRDGPTSRISAKKSRNATTVHTTESTATEPMVSAESEAGMVAMPAGAYSDGGHHERRRDHADRRQVSQPAADDDRAHRVAEGDDDRLARCPARRCATMSRPTRAATPANPMKSPASRRASKWSATPNARYEHGADQRHRRDQQPGQRAGDALLGVGQQQPRDAELDDGVQEHPRPAARSRRRISPRRSANGRSRSAAGAVRRKTSAGGGSSRTATRMKRYGMPQITHSVMNSSQPLRDTGVLPSNGRRHPTAPE